MKVWIKRLGVNMEIKPRGHVEVDVSEGGVHTGDLYITRTQLIWCRGRTSKKHGIKLRWEDFIEYMESL